MSAPAARLAGASAAVLCALALVAASPARAAAPPPCGGVPQVVDVSGGHHPGTDVLSAWFSEAAGRLQAVVRVRSGSWVPEHEDEAVDVAGYALLFEVAGRTAFVRVQVLPSGAASYDYGTFDGARFRSEGASNGELVYAPYGGTATIDVPAATGAVPGARLARPFALTYDGTGVDGLPHWVDQAPGVDQPGDPARGTDYVVGSCAGGQPSGDAVVAVELKAPSSRRGSGVARVTGRVVPALGGLPVALTRRGPGALVSRGSTSADGSFAFTVPVRETTRLSAVVGGVASATAVLRVRSVVRIGLRKRPSGALRIFGRVDPPLPGRLLVLGVNEVRPSLVRRSGPRRFRIPFRAGRLERGGYQVVYIPAKGRGERSTSNVVRVR